MKTIGMFAGGLIVIIAVVIGLVYFMQRSMMYFPSPEKQDIAKTGFANVKEVSLQTADGLDLYAWYKAPVPATKPTIVWFHGNASNVAITSYRAATYIKHGYGLLAVEYRGYGGNPGKPSEEGLYNDARAAIEWLKQNGVSEDSIILYGESIGSGPAIQMAVEYKGLHAVVLDSPLSSATEIASYHYPFLPVKWLISDKYDNLSKIAKISAPLILAHGTADTIIPYQYGQKLFNAAPEPKSMITLEGAGHNNMDEFRVAEKIISVLSE